MSTSGEAKNLKLAENLANESEQLFEAIVNNFPDIIHSVDEEGIIVSTNPAAERILGYKREELIGRSVFDIYCDDVRDQVRAGFNRLKSNGSLRVAESRMKAKNGEPIDVEVRSLSLYDDSGRFVKTFSIIRDIREVKQLREQLVQSGKLAAVGELAAGIMHDIRNPLAVIVGYNELLGREIKTQNSSETMQKVHAAIGRAATKIDRLSVQMRDFVRGGTEETTEFLAATAIADSLLMVESRIRSAGVKVVNNVEGSPCKIWGRQNQVEQVLINLLGNSADALEGRAGERLVTISSAVDTEWISISIADSGPGIPENIREKIFDAFFTTKPRGKGTGLGLSICNGIVAEHGGKLALWSEIGKGAKFTITLPLVPVTVPAPTDLLPEK